MDREALEDLWFGDNACLACHGAGCDACAGTGQERQMPCPLCQGAGTRVHVNFLTVLCEHCRGLGRVPASSLKPSPARRRGLPGWLVLVLLAGGAALAYCLFFLLTHP